ncbi:MAG: endonuclease domain-containing protein [Pseudolabrys sp.]
MPHSAIASQTRRQARRLRKDPTDAERKIWKVLQSLKPLGIHFRRQAPVGNYIADFAWHAGKLVVELDGGQHATAQRAYDAKRTAWLESQGYRVLRFWNNDALKTPHSVGEAILTVARERSAMPENPTPDPSPQGGGAQTGAIGKDTVQ